jgi:hypothetical protein
VNGARFTAEEYALTDISKRSAIAAGTSNDQRRLHSVHSEGNSRNPSATHRDRASFFWTCPEALAKRIANG